ncbi:MAG: hypothetical protein NVS9B10_26520 [Nevskia sp.]
MKTILFISALVLAPLPLMAADVGVSINVGQPGFYGQINIGRAPPAVVYDQPVIIEQAPAYSEGPIYLRVRPGYERDWAHHCREYRACGRPVYFVQDDWYQREYVQHHHHEDDEDGNDDEDHDHGHGHGRGHGHGHGHGDD